LKNKNLHLFLTQFIVDPSSCLAFRRKSFDPINRAIRQRCAHLIAAANGALLDLEYRLRCPLPFCFKRIEHIDNIDHFPKLIRL